ncbi:hypothetical protein EDB84DRAFT_1572527 [Lactarius hengduanensis]|nr:hypothetical protein EDB84DRAFT_1572527 [Lactarius hengduanensis]
MVQNRTPSLRPSPPLLPLPSPTPLVSKGGRSVLARSHAHTERELTGVCRPLSAPPYSRHTRVTRTPTPSFLRIDRRRPLRTQIKSARAFPVSVPPRSRGRGPMMPAADRPLPSPRRPASGAHEGTPPARSPPPSLLSAPPPFARKGACEGNAPSRGTPFAWEGAHEAKPSPPPRCAAGPPRRKGKPAPHLQPTPVAPPSSRTPPPPSFAQTGSRRGHAPAPPYPRTQEGGQRAHHVPWRGRRQPSPPPPTHARGGTACPPSPLRAGNASPATRTPHCTARARKGRRRRPTPPHGPFQPRVYAPHHTRGHRRVGAPSPATSTQGAPPG